MFLIEQLRMFVREVENQTTSNEDYRLLTVKQLAGATYMLYNNDNLNKKYIVMVQDSNVTCHAADEDLLRDLFPEFA